MNDIEEQFHTSHIYYIDVEMGKIFMLVYADDIVIYVNCPAELQSGLDFLSQFCSR